MAKDIEELKTRSMRDNVIPETKDEEDLKGAVAASMLKMGLDLSGIEYDRIHRLGPATPNNKPRAIVAKPCLHRDTQRLLSHRKVGINKKNDPWISPQFPESVREERIQLAQIADMAHRKDRKTKSKIAQNALYINGQKVLPPLEPVSPAEVLLLPKAEQRELLEIKFAKTNVISVKGSTFTGRGTPVTSLNDVRKAQKSLMLHQETVQASHNIICYLLPNGTSGYFDDHDYGMGRRMLQTLEQQERSGIMVVLTRFYGGNKLGPQRFEVARDITRQVCLLLPKAQKEGSIQARQQPQNSSSQPTNLSSQATRNRDVTHNDILLDRDIISSTSDVTDRSTRQGRDVSGEVLGLGNEPSKQDTINTNATCGFTGSVRNSDQAHHSNREKDEISGQEHDNIAIIEHAGDEDDLNVTASSDLLPDTDNEAETKPKCNA